MQEFTSILFQILVFIKFIADLREKELMAKPAYRLTPINSSVKG